MSKEQKNNSNNYAELKSGKRPKFKRGNPGRPKGAKDKVSKNIKDNFEAVFEKLGGVEGFFDWADQNSRNKGTFYQMYSKMLPSNVNVEGDLKVTYQLSEKYIPKIGNEKK